MIKRRLIILRDALLSLEESNKRKRSAKKRIEFSIDTWGYRKETPLPPDECGTVCCAAGLATTIPEFRRLGLRGCSGFSFKPAFRGATGVRAMAKFLGIGQYDAQWLFVSVAYSMFQRATPQDVARRIDRILAGGRTC